MPAPTSYTEATLAAFMHSSLGTMATHLGWTVAANSYSEAVNSAILSYGVATIDLATDIAKLRALALVEVWKAALMALSGEFTFSADGSSFSLSELQLQAKASLQLAQESALRYSDDYAAVYQPLEFVNDPYDAGLEDEDREIYP